jgi:hypothetical protein
MDGTGETDEAVYNDRRAVGAGLVVSLEGRAGGASRSCERLHEIVEELARRLGHEKVCALTHELLDSLPPSPRRTVEIL